MNEFIKDEGGATVVEYLMIGFLVAVILLIVCGGVAVVWKTITL